MDHATVSFNLLTTESSQGARWISERLEGMSGDRGEAVDKIIKKSTPKLVNQNRRL